MVLIRTRGRKRVITQCDPSLKTVIGVVLLSNFICPTEKLVVVDEKIKIDFDQGLLGHEGRALFQRHFRSRVFSGK